MPASTGCAHNHRMRESLDVSSSRPVARRTLAATGSCRDAVVWNRVPGSRPIYRRVVGKRWWSRRLRVLRWIARSSAWATRQSRHGWHADELGGRVSADLPQGLLSTMRPAAQTHALSPRWGTFARSHVIDHTSCAADDPMRICVQRNDCGGWEVKLPGNHARVMSLAVRQQASLVARDANDALPSAATGKIPGAKVSLWLLSGG